MSRNACIGVIALITLLSMIRVATTHRVFAQIVDEPVHVAAGFDWLLSGDYSLDMEHPPLARVLLAIPLRMMRDTAPESKEWVTRGNDLLLTNDRYQGNLARVRLPNLIFLAAAIGFTAAWAWSLAGPTCAMIAAAMVACLQPMLAHAGFATTDMAGVATTTAAMFAFSRWLDAPSKGRSALLGLAIGAGLLSKFSFLLFFPAGAAVIAISRRRFPIRTLWPAIVIAPLIIWAGYRFQFSTLAEASPHAVGLVSSVTKSAFLTDAAKTIPVPAPLFIAGLFNVKSHDIAGHLAFLLGRQSWRGFWYYFPVAIFFKTPLPFLILAAIGLLIGRRPAWESLGVAAAFLVVTMTASINIGVRHVLAVFPPMAIAAAIAMQMMWRIQSGRIGGIILAAWLVAGSIAAHPDYISWFNEAAGRHPDEILVDSNLDWGQDVIRLSRACRTYQIRELYVSLLTSAPLERLGFPPLKGLPENAPVTGWVAVSETIFHLRRPQYGWLEGQKYVRIGTSIRLYDMR